ncbi:MAG: hypothetical protein HY868_24265 [Chloroflexi bacterium]|nr:hypothetical protein [Chloroflexota bacterium]
MLIRLGLLMLLGLSACSIAPARIVVEWTTATEINTAGFNLYRGASADGPFAKVNDQLIAASPDPVTGGKYRFEDATVVPGQTYYYQLEDVEFSGRTARHGPIVITAPGGIGAIEIALGAGLLVLAALVLIGMRRKRVGHVGDKFSKLA